VETKTDRFYELLKLIEEAAFTKRRIKYDPIEKDIQDMATPHLFFTKRKYEGTTVLEFFHSIRLFNVSLPEKPYPKSIKTDLSPKDIKSITVLNHHLNSFLFDVAEEMWRFEQDAQSNATEELKRETLNAAKDRLEGMGFSEKSISKAIKVLELNKKTHKGVRNFRTTRDYKYFTKTNPKGDDWIIRETDTIARIREMYRNSFNEPIHGDTLSLDPLSEREIIRNMTLVFDAIGFWPDSEIGKTYEKIKKRLQRHDKRRIDTTLFDP
jgi:hypothetical protein